MKVTITDSPNKAKPPEYDIARDDNYHELGATAGQVKTRIRRWKPDKVIDLTEGKVFSK